MNLIRLKAMIIKEYKQMFRDNSNILLGVIVPLLLIIIFGYGLSLDVNNSPVAVVTSKISDERTEYIYAMDASEFLSVTTVRHIKDAEKLLINGKVDAIVLFDNDFEINKNILIIVSGIDANYGRIVQTYIKNALISKVKLPDDVINVDLTIRTWFNSEQSSKYALISGLVVLIITLIGALLTALVMAKEWERGTLESIFVTPVRIIEVIIGKIIPYMSLGLIGFIMCLFAAKFLFKVPFHGSLIVITACGILYLFVSLGLGLAISSAVKNQFIACQLVLVGTFLPSIMLSGFIFDLTSAPVIVQIFAHILPATWFVELLQTLLLAGNVYSIITKDMLILFAYMCFFMLVTIRVTRKSLE